MEDNNYDFSKLNNLYSLKKFCDSNIEDIVGGNLLKLSSPIKVRYVDFFGKFGVTSLGRFFFVDDCMYLLTNDERYKEEHNPDIASFFGEEAYLYSLSSGKFIVRVIFAGIYTGFSDDKGNRIFTGDVVKASVLSNPYFPSKGDSDRAKNRISQDKGDKYEAGISDFLREFSLILDNNTEPLSWTSKIKVIGSLFFRLEKETTEVPILNLCDEFAKARPKEKKELLELIKKSPYFPPKTWQEKALEMLGVNDD